jgi:very-short-patch-repair endonuclease
MAYVVEGYLTEEKLVVLLSSLPNLVKIEQQSKLGRYRIDVLLTVKIDDVDKTFAVEFDGPNHYIEYGTILRDNNKNSLLEQNGIPIIRIPYFVQLTSETFKHYFGFDFEIETTFPHGFISPKAPTPEYFHISGFRLFYKQLKELPETVKDLIYSSIRHTSNPEEARILPGEETEMFRREYLEFRQDLFKPFGPFEYDLYEDVLFEFKNGDPFTEQELLNISKCDKLLCHSLTPSIISRLVAGELDEDDWAYFSIRSNDCRDFCEKYIPKTVQIDFYNEGVNYDVHGYASAAIVASFRPA